jgi:hypothetical protein
MFNKVDTSLFKPLLTLAFAVGVAFGYGLEVGINKAISVTEQKERHAQTEFQYVTRVDYEQLTPGMSLTDVQAILDRGIEINRSETTATFLWQNSNGSYITVTFKNGKLISKAQSKLN